LDRGYLPGYARVLARPQIVTLSLETANALGGVLEDDAGHGPSRLPDRAAPSAIILAILRVSSVRVIRSVLGSDLVEIGRAIDVAPHHLSDGVVHDPETSNS
jgi:hypothetical protein